MKEFDISYRSVSMLEVLVSELLQSPILISDWAEYLEHNEINKYSHVLAAGLFYQKIFEINDWPLSDFSFYCLCSSVKKTLVNLLGFDADVIGVIPRYKLFPVKTNSTLRLDDSNFSLIHAGRISPQKNIEFIILVSFYFQILHSRNIELTLMGNYDNDYHRNAKGIYTTNYETKIIRLINSLPWIGKKPTVVTSYSQTEWTSHFPANGIFFSASNFISEDFSVATAQVQQFLGNPCLVPYWGGFKDVCGENIMFYDVNCVASSHESLLVTSQKARLFVKSFIDKNLFFSPPDILEQVSLEFPVKINRNYLQERIKKNKEKWGPEIAHIEEGNFHLFAKSENGQSFFKEYFKIFSE